jgi:phosphodiesterase/alkaline phosphatase D-like protein
VVLSSLQPSRVYYYRVGNAEEGWSEEFSFLSAPTVGPNSGVNIFAFGDSGTARCQEMEPWCQPNADATYKDINWDKRTDPSYSMVLHIGDISYAIGYSWRWEQFFSDIEPIASTMPYMVAIGNHEYDWPGQSFKPNWSNYGYDSGGECGMPYFKRFKMPGATTNLWYSYDHGNIHFTVMSTEHDFLPGSEQYQFLVNDMASVDRSKTPWLVFVGHRFVLLLLLLLLYCSLTSCLLLP